MKPPTQNIQWFAILILIFILTIPQMGRADVLSIQPYAQWTFDTPIKKIIYRPSGTGFPIKLMLTKENVTLYDSTGSLIRELTRTPGDKFVINHRQNGFMLVQINASNLIERAEILYSFQVYDFEGKPEYTAVERVNLNPGEMIYQLTDERSILVTEVGSPRVHEIHGEETILEVRSCQSGISKPGTAFAVASKLKSRNAMVTAVSCRIAGDSASTELRLWNHDQVIGSPVLQQGSLKELITLPGTDYFFLEVERGIERSLSLFNRTQLISTYPWQSWKIQLVNQKTAFVISEKDFNIVNLGDGSIASNYHPIDLSTISDAVYLSEWGIYLYLRYESFYREDGRQAYRNFQLEGVNKAGRIIHRSSFGTWTYSLPKIASIGKDLFGIQLHNAVLMYGIKLERK